MNQKEKPYLPIIYVRGYAATQKEINDTVDDPFYGFNLGSTHTRVGANGRPEQFFFESPLVRLMSDYQYLDVYHGQEQRFINGDSNEFDPWRTLWIFRFYDETSDTFDKESRRLSIEEAAGRLRLLIRDIKAQTGAPAVHLVAHSMGGLVCRSLLQKIYPDSGENGIDHVARFFTFATPHGGIQLRRGFGFLEGIRDALGIFSSDDFGPKRMCEYLTPEKEVKANKEFPQNSINGKFPIERIFCMIGTNAHDYDVASGGSRTIVGPQSDGLVQIGAAFVEGAHRGYVHRCHSGRYGIVNSEEAFQNLERFLFGNIQSVISLRQLSELPSPKDESFQLDVQVSVRGLPVFMNEQTREHFCPVVLNDSDKQEVPSYPIFTQYLNSKFAKKGRPSRFAVRLALKRLPVKAGSVVGNEDNLHGIPTWADTLLVDVELSTNPPSIQVGWLSAASNPSTNVELKKMDDGSLDARVDLPANARKHLGESACLLINSRKWEA